MSAAGRNSSGSARSPRHRNQVNLSTIEKSVTHLLVATKQLLETLTAWSRQQATEAEVSDVYVRLGSEFNIACRAFTAIGVETADLGNVPDALRTILENTLSQDASPQSLDVYLPRIREIIINLLHGLKRKQQKLRQKQTKDGEGSGTDRGSGGSGGSISRPPKVSNTESNGDRPERTTSLPDGGSAPKGPQPAYRDSAPATGSESSHQATDSVSSVNGRTNDTPSSKAKPPYPTIEEPRADSPGPTAFMPPPPPPPPSSDALAALQQHTSLERRASKRYSAYQIAKLTGKNPHDVSVIARDPTTTPRNRESMDAVRKRLPQGRSSVKAKEEPSPMRNPNRISEEADPDKSYSPIAKTPEDKVGPITPVSAPTEVVTEKQGPLTINTGATPSQSPPPGAGPTAEVDAVITNGVSHTEAVTTEIRGATPTDSKELTLFLQLGRSIKKVVLSEGFDDLSRTSLRLLFISKFNYNPPSGDDFPEIYLQDPVSGVRYELEDLRDVKDRAVLCLNVEVLDEVKRHIDDGMDGLKQIVQGIAGSVQSQALQINRVAERQEEAAKKIAELSVAPSVPTPPVMVSESATPPVPLSKQESEARLLEVREFRKDLAVLRQVYSAFAADVNTSIATIKTKAKSVKQVATNAAISSNEGRAYVEKGKTTLSTDADILVTRVDDLQDTVEDLRKDVVARGVRPLPRQLEIVSKEIAQARTELKRMNDYIKVEKPLYRRVWERELEVVCEEQEFFNMQENLIADLEDDLDKAMQTFALVEQCSEQQIKTNPNGSRNISRGFIPNGLIHPDEQLDPSDAKDNVLSEVRALQPNHESRLEAIERAEKARQKELEGRVPEFQKELGKFVEENKLKKTGGAEEVERLRVLRDEQTRREMWERQKQMEEEESSEEEDSDEEEEEEDTKVDDA
ncbi:actin interacting protein 3-domain-containing protein [Geopyxis carbonaria]|nr:actin interacting protein 3-domain-containing protein [Geopyxis carbonaria]